MVHPDSDRPMMASLAAEEERRRADAAQREVAAVAEAVARRDSLTSRILGRIRRALSR
jgi:hypothetical protein